MRRISLFFYIFFGTIVFGSHVLAGEKLVIDSIKVYPENHKVRFTWQTNFLSDSWVAIDPIVTQQYYYRDPKDGQLKEKTRETYWRGHWANFSLPDNSMLGRCDGGGDVKHHCVELLTPFPNTEYRYQLHSCGKNEVNEGVCDTTQILVFQSGRDTKAPSAPENVQALFSYGKVYLFWDPSQEDNPRFYPGYKIYRDGKLVHDIRPEDARPSNWTRDVYDVNQVSKTKLPRLEYFHPKIDGGTAYTIIAYDKGGNESKPVTAVNTGSSTPSQSTVTKKEASKKKLPPAPPTSLFTGVSMTPCCGVEIKWQEPSDPGGQRVGIKEYRVFRDGKQIGTTAKPTYHDQNLGTKFTHSYYVIAVDKDGDVSQPSTSTSVGISSGPQTIVQPVPKPVSQTPATPLPKSTTPSLSTEKSHFNYFRLGEKQLEFKYTFVPDESEIKHNLVDYDAPPRCYGRTYFFDEGKKDWVDAVNGEFVGSLELEKADTKGVWKGKPVPVTLQPTTMRYSVRCGLLTHTIEVKQSDWGSDQEIREFKSLQKGKIDQRSTAKKKTTMIPKGVDTTVKTDRGPGTKKDIVDVYSIDVPASAAFNPRPGDKKAIVGLADFIVYEPIRVERITVTTQDSKNRPFSRLYLELDGKPMSAQFDSYDVKTGEMTFSGFRDIALVEKMDRGKHHFAILADVRNPGKWNILTDHFAITDIQAKTGPGVKARFKGLINMKAFTVRKRAVKPGTGGGASEIYE